jgi:hypothetical protein
MLSDAEAHLMRDGSSSDDPRHALEVLYRQEVTPVSVQALGSDVEQARARRGWNASLPGRLRQSQDKARTNLQVLLLTSI